MPQITIEYSANIAGGFDGVGFAHRLHQFLPDMVDTQLAACKTRLVEHGRFVIGEGAGEHAMIHVDLRILSGRSEEQKRRLGEAAIAALAEFVRKPDHLKLQLTLEVRDLDRENYHKQLL